jgi:hypothetical protein
VQSALLAAAVVLLLVAIGVHVVYLRGLAKAGVEVSRATKVVSYVNIGLLMLIVLGLLGYGIYGQTTGGM